MASNPNFNPNLFNGPIPGEGLTRTPNGAPYHQPPQFVHLDDLLESLWAKMNNSENNIQIYGLLKAGVPAEAIARTLLFGAFSHGVCTVTLAQLALPTVVKQIAALGTFLGLTKIKIKNHKPETTQQLAEIQRAIDKFGDSDEEDDTPPTQLETPATGKSSVFTGLGI